MRTARARRRAGLLLAALLAWAALPAAADELTMVRSVQPFPEAMLTLQEAIKAQGYTITRVQRVDVGLTRMGYKTDLYSPAGTGTCRPSWTPCARRAEAPPSGGPL